MLVVMLLLTMLMVMLLIVMMMLLLLMMLLLILMVMLLFLMMMLLLFVMVMMLLFDGDSDHGHSTKDKGMMGDLAHNPTLNIIIITIIVTVIIGIPPQGSCIGFKNSHQLLWNSFHSLFDSVLI